MSNGLKRWAARFFGHWALWVLVAAVLGILLGNFVFGSYIGKPTVGVVRINSTLFPWTSPEIHKMLKYVTEQDDIKAVVLEIESPGGEVVTTEEIYLRILELRQKKPVVASLGIVSASGGYYISVAASYIYAKPTSTLGSIGVVVSLPEREIISEDLVWTGPFKDTGSSRRDAINRLDIIKQGFLESVLSQRGDKLKIGKEELSKASLYNGMESLSYGLIDEFGSVPDAVRKAAELAGLRNYEIIDVNKETSAFLPPWWFGFSLAEASKLQSNTVPVYYYLYAWPEAQQ